MANEIYTYKNFLMSVGKFPAFCNEGDLDLCKRELSTFFAHTTHECGYESPYMEYPTWRQGFYWITEIACTPPTGQAVCDYSDPTNIWWPPTEGVQYYGRGPFQLSWNYNYGQFSVAFYNDD